MGRKIIGYLICLLLLLPATAFGEKAENSVLGMEELSIQVMPEFARHPEDKETGRPPLLIGYQGSLINHSDKSQKGKIEIPLPMKDKNFRIGFVADYSSDLSQMYEIEYELDPEKGTISWQTSREIEPNGHYKFIIEFYTDNLKTNKGLKNLEYTFKSFADINLVTLTVLEPIKASRFKLEPEADSPHSNSYGLKMHTYMINGMKTGQEKAFRLSYSRTEKKTTNELMEMEGGNKSVPAKAKKTEKVPLGLTITGISAASLLAAGLLLLILNRNRQAAPAAASETGDMESKRAQLRRMLMEGSITESEYNELKKELNL